MSYLNVKSDSSKSLLQNKIVFFFLFPHVLKAWKQLWLSARREFLGGSG